MSSHRAIAKSVLAAYGQTYCAEVGIKLKNTPSPLYRWLVASTLFSARISTSIAMDAARALSSAGWRTAQKMADATWKERTDVLNRAGYARYDESTSRVLGDSAAMLLEKYDGDLRKLREEADCDVEAERKLLKQCKGIGDVGADIFFREVQSLWDEHFPFADKRALSAAERLGLPADAKRLSQLVSREEFVPLVSGLVRTHAAQDFEKIKQAA